MGVLPVHPHSSGPLISEPLQGLAKLLAALVNPFTVIYAIISTRKSGLVSLLFYAGAIVTGCVTIHIFLGIAGIQLLMGYYLWTTGIALILVSPLDDCTPGISGWLRKGYGAGPA
jgi:hypothetical protein